MSELRDFYAGIGYEQEQLEKSLEYLADLTLQSAIEIDNHLLGRNQNFDSTKELVEILQKYQLKDNHDALTAPVFPYMPLWHAMQKSSDKTIRQYSELALEMKLLNLELIEVPSAPKNRLEEMRSFLCELSKEFSTEQYWCGQPYRMAA